MGKGKKTGAPLTGTVAPMVAPPLVKMGKAKDDFEAKRQEVFPKWKAALEAAEGNVTHAAVAFWPGEERKKARNRGNKLSQDLELAEYAASLRLAATGKKIGRPKSLE